MSVQVPSFNLGKTKLSNDEFNAAVAEKSGGKGFEPGNYTLKVTDVQYHANKDTGAITAADPTWINVAVTLTGADGRTKKQFVLVPTSSIQYVTKEGKKTTFLFRQLKDFMAGLGIYLDSGNYATVLPQVFGSQEGMNSLVGLDINLDIGYKGPYAAFVEKGKYNIMINGEAYAEGGEVKNFPDRDSAVAFAAATLQKTLAKFPEILKFHPSKERKLEQPAQTSGW